jgi:hypothetical protein
MQAETQDLINRFLLGKLSEDERAGVEKRFLSDNDFFEQVLAAEDGLIDQYLLGALSKEDMSEARALFESSRLQQDKLESTRSLISLIQSSSSGSMNERAGSIGTLNSAETYKSKSSLPNPADTQATIVTPSRRTGHYFLGWGWAVTSLVLVLLSSSVVYLLYKKRAMETRQASVEQMIKNVGDKLNQETARSTELDAELSAERERRQKAEELLSQLQDQDAPRVTTVLLTPTSFQRGEGSRFVRLRLSTGQIRLQLMVGQELRFDRYSVIISTFDNREVWKTNSLDSHSARQGKLSLILPTDLFSPQDYRIEVRGSSGGQDSVHVADFAIRISR